MIVIITYVLLAAFFAWMVWIGVRASRVPAETKAENFLIANRGAIGILVAIGVTMSWVDATSFGFVGGMGYADGWGILGYILGASFSLLYMAVLAPRVRALGAKGGMYMMSDIIRQNLSRRTGAISALAVFAYFGLWMLIQFIVGPQVVQAVLGIPPVITSIVMGGVTLIYLMLGGFRSQLYTDLAQFVLFAVMALILVELFIPSFGTWVAPVSTYASLGIAPWITLFVLNFASTVAAPDIWQRLYSARSEKDARSSMIWSAILMTLAYLVFTFFGMIVKFYNWAPNSNEVAPAIFTHIVPHWILPVAVVMFFALIMSTIATTLFGSAMAVSNDFLFGMGYIKRERISFWQRVIMAVLIVITVAITSTNLNLITITIYALSACIIPLPIVLSLLYKIRISEKAAFASMLVSTAIFVAGIALNFLNGAGALWPLAGSIVVLLVTELFVRMKPGYGKAL